MKLKIDFLFFISGNLLHYLSLSKVKSCICFVRKESELLQNKFFEITFLFFGMLPLVMENGVLKIRNIDRETKSQKKACLKKKSISSQRKAFS